MAYFEKIEAYITGKLAPADRMAFEEQLKNDSNLKHELDLQNDIVQAIKASRHAQLKSNLSQVPVGSATGGVSPWWIAAASGVLVVGALSWYLINNSHPQVPIIATTTTEKNISNIETTADIVKPAETTESLPIVSGPVKDDQVAVSKKPGKNVHYKEPVNVMESPDVDMPDADITSSEIGNTTPIIKGDAVVPSNQILVEINDDDKSKFHYQSGHGKLILYGNFKTSPYELIEIHANGGSSVYLKFEKQYYTILNNQKQMHKLSAIHDKALLSQLSKVNNK